jgi:hypothetical protein
MDLHSRLPVGRTPPTVVIPFPVRRHRTGKLTTQIVHPHIPSARERRRKEAHKRRVLAFLEEQMRKQTGNAEI